MTTKKKLFFAAGLALAVVFFLLSRRATPESEALSARREAMKLLGAQIIKLRPNANVLVLGNPFSRDAGVFDERKQFERAALRGLRDGLGRSPSITVVFPEIKPEYVANPASVMIPPDSKTPLSFIIKSDAVDQLAAAHPECNVIVSLIGLPVGIERLKVWDQKNPISLGLLLPDLRWLGGPAETVAAFQRGKLLAAVFEKPGTNEHLVVTGENIAPLMQQQPKLLGF